MFAGVADTHTAIWYLFDDPRLSRVAADFMDRSAAEGHQIAVSSVTLAEIVYLIEKGKIPANTYQALREAIADPEHLFKEAHLTADIVDAMCRIPRSEVPDMPDRMVAATALFLGVPTLSKDRRIQSSVVKSIW